MLLRFTLLCALLISMLICAAPLRAAGREGSVKDYSIEVWDVNRGFSPFSISAIVQSPDGYLWLGTDDGLVRFDGVQFTPFNTNTTPRLQHNNISSLCIQNDSSLWIGMNGGGISRFKNNIFYPYTIDQGLPENNVLSIAAGHGNVIWAGTASKGFVQLKQSNIRIFAQDPTRNNVPVYALSETNAGVLRIGLSRDFGLKYPSADSVICYRGNPYLIFSIAELHNGMLLLGTTGGVYQFDGNEVRPFANREVAAIQSARAIVQDNSGTIWFGTEGNGLFRFADSQLTRMTTREGFPSDRILSIFQDKQENLWVGTRGGGLVRLRHSTVMTLATSAGAADEQVSAVYQDRNDQLWIATRGSGVYVVRDGTRLRQFTSHDGLSGNHVRALFEDSRGDVWVGTQSGLHRFLNPARGTSARIVPMMINGHQIGSVRALVEDRHGVIWIGSTSSGVIRYSPGSSTTKQYTLGSQGEYIPVRTMLEDHRGTLWIGTRGGLATVDGDAVVPFQARNHLSSREVFSLLEDEQGALWIGTYGEGLLRLKNDTLNRCTKQDGLFDDVVYTILDDGAGYFWMSCNKGIFRVSKDGLNDFLDKKIASVSSTSFGTAEGMRSVECNGGSQTSGWKTRDGKLMFATMKGVAVIDPARTGSPTVAPATMIEEVAVDDSITSAVARITIAPGKRKFEVRYTGLSFVLPEKIQFRYRLKGYDDHWVDAGTRRKAYYTNIPPGSYTFEVRARHPEKEWDEQTASLPIEVVPFLWETAWFRGLALVAALALVFLFVKRREHKINAESRRSVEIQKQLVELESRALRAQMNPHFIFNSLNSIQESILSQRTEAACEYLAKFAMLIRMILENSEQPKITLDREIDALRIYLELESLRFDEAFSYAVHIDPLIEPSSYTIPPMLIQPYVENAIWHGLSYKEGARALSVNISQQDSSLLCVVQDNGVGRERAAAIKNPLKQDYESKGMRVTRERLDLMSTQKSGISQVRIVDLYDERHQPAGTRVEITIPC